jgi:hypothetical protein
MARRYERGGHTLAASRWPVPSELRVSADSLSKHFTECAFRVARFVSFPLDRRRTDRGVRTIVLTWLHYRIA